MAAIYQWFIGKEMVLTTTPYPIEAIEYVQISCDLDQLCRMDNIPGDSADMSMLMIGAVMTEVRLDMDLVEDSADMSFLLINVVMTTVRLDMNEVSDSADMSFLFIGAEMKRVRIDALVPDEAMDISCDLDTANCSMTDA